MVHRDHLGRVIARPSGNTIFTLPPKAPACPGLKLTSYDTILVSISGGKDSQAALHTTVKAAEKAGVLDRVETVFADLGKADEWPGTRELATDHAAAYGLPHHVVHREVTDADGNPWQQGLLEYIGSRWQQKWPLPNQPYCRSEMKRDPIAKLKTQIAADHRAAGITDRPARILEVMGIRAQESAPRSKQKPFSTRGADSNSRRHVDVWLPIHHLTEEQTWAVVDEAGTRWHWIYLFLSRLSCRFCIVAPREQLIQAARLDPQGARQRARLAERMGHDFKHELNLWDVIAEAEALGPVDTSRLTPAALAELEIMQAAAGVPR
ncbi:phosphoadenosine phosphosulfate reductase family protein [Spirillospora sp. CA-108201]